MNKTLIPLALAFVLFGAVAPAAQAETFNYHGSLSSAGKAADGSYDLRLTLYSSEKGGSVLAGPIDLHGVDVRDGNFSTAVDFGPASTSMGGWLGVDVRTAGGAWESLDGRSTVAPTGSACPGSWTLDGNAGNPVGSYLGTADAQDVLIKAGGVNAMYVRAGTGAVEVYPWGGAPAPGQGAFSTGLSNGAVGPYSFAAGYNSKTNNSGSFVWGDRGSAATYSDSAANQFIIGAKGGVGINTSTADDGTAPLDNTLTLAPVDGSSVVSFGMRVGGNSSWRFSNFFSGMMYGYKDSTGTFNLSALFGTNQTLGLNGAAASAAQPLKVGHDASTGNGAYLSGGGVWTNASSRFFKQGFADVNPADVLGKLVKMPIQTWTYLDGGATDGRHLGPVAEDFATAFGLGQDSQHISTVDANGVALVAIQGLNSKLEGDNAELRGRLDQVQAENAALRERIEKLAVAVEHLSNKAE
ncbi:MAG: tail fiber domain-containing protein [Dokdonella sp.]|uniref:tail fiber domain-containing protein n=1 Tax=Dokdonella sp. TaxID=2291710 RepID=UPI0025BDBB27|nr:tail fiber domain-containing protein [Dokdonella sp.]MBZ0222833.1 tail fiber domain-containing protein [Dokdonella sp.]